MAAVQTATAQHLRSSSRQAAQQQPGCCSRRAPAGGAAIGSVAASAVALALPLSPCSAPLVEGSCCSHIGRQRPCCEHGHEPLLATDAAAAATAAAETRCRSSCCMRRGAAGAREASVSSAMQHASCEHAASCASSVQPCAAHAPLHQQHHARCAATPVLSM